MLGRMMASALALTGMAYAQAPGEGETGVTPPDCLPTPQCAAAPVQSSADRVVYDAGFFRQYNPSNALDMVRQTPGFALNGGDDRRGFSGAVGNLLIDGLRPSTKSQSLDGILSRIPANQVVRVEILRGAAVAGDASGQSTLLNIVRTPSAGSGVWEAGFELTSRDVPAPRGEISYSGRNGNVEYGVGASIYSQYRDLPGWRAFYDGAGAYAGRTETPSPRDTREGAVNGNIAFPLAGGRLSATGQIDGFRFHADNDFYRFDAADNPVGAHLQDFTEENVGFEVGVNYDRDLGPWSMALIGLVNRSRYDSDEVNSFHDGAGTLTGAFLQDIRQESGETIARGTLARPIGARQRIEFGAEAAFNSLDQELDGGGSPPPPVFANANVLIEEERAELFGSHSFRPADNWSIDTRLAWETSTFTFTGDTNQEVELSYWKPSLQISRTFAGNNQVRARIYRDVGQIDFGDFVSAASTADAIISGGNPDLVPQTSWIAELGADLRYNGAALSLTLSHHQITDVADVVYIPAAGFDAPGNIGDGEVTRLDVNFSTPVPLIPGGRLTIEGYLRDTEVTDPFTGRQRIISFAPESQLEISFRQDLPDLRFSWGVEVFKEGEFQAYRFNEIDTNEEGPWVDLFVETTALPNNAKLRVWAANIFDGDVRRDRRFFNEPDGSGGILGRRGANTSRELRRRQFASAPWLIVELSGSF